jgi:predicted permease
MDELRLAIRRLSKRPASTLASIATLSCAIGAAAVTWSVLSSVLINPLPVKEPERLVVVATESPGRRGPIVRTGFVYPHYQQIRDSGPFESTVAQWSGTHLLLVDLGDMPVRTDVAFVTHDYFDVLGVSTVLGRGFAAEDDRRGAAPVAVLTDRYWRRSLNADPAAIGRTINVAGETVTIVGVLQPRFRGLNLSEKPDLYLAFHTIAAIGSPLTNYFAEPTHQSSPTSGTVIIGRLKPSISARAAAEQLSALPGVGRSGGERLLAMPVNVAAVPAAARPGMVRFSRLLAVTVGSLLLIGCAAVGMLLLLRTEARRTEFAMCLALGASRGRLARGIALEGALLAAAGALSAIPVAAWLFGLVHVFQLPGGISVELLELKMDQRVLIACAAGSGAAVVLIAVIAGVFGFRASLGDALHSKPGVSARLSGRAIRTILVSAQVAVTLMLLAGAGLFIRSLTGALSLNAAIDMSRIVIGTIHVGAYGYTPERASEFFVALKTRLNASPALRTAAFSRWEGGMSPFGKLRINRQDRQFPSLVSYIRVDPDYFRAMNIRITAGRGFERGDTAGSPPVAIVSESFGRLLADGGKAMGSVIEGFSSTDKPVTVVGIASDVITNVTVLEPLIVYLPDSQGAPSVSRDLAAVAASDAADARREILAAMRGLDPKVTPVALRTLEERVADQMAPQLLGGTVLGALGTLATLLTMLGTYVLADWMATARMREMAIRAALGATRRQLGSMVLSETVRLVGLGIIAGLGLAWLGASTIRSFLFQVQPLDPATLGVVAASILLLALLVSLRAALRAARVDLAAVLKAE